MLLRKFGTKAIIGEGLQIPRSDDGDRTEFIKEPIVSVVIITALIPQLTDFIYF
jgi:hypothetical protein